MIISGSIAIDSLPPIPWKNGGGVTRTVAVEPPLAGMSDFLWRISIAELQAAGSFSPFPGIDRSILLWRGTGLTLRSPSWPDHTLTASGEPFLFAGEDDVSCELLNGPSQDLNLMVRRNAVDAVLKVSTDLVRGSPHQEELIVLCAEGSLQIELDDSRKYLLEEGHFMRISQPDSEVVLVPSQQQTRFVYVSISLPKGLPG